MKKTLSLFAAAIILFVSAGCQKAPAGPVPSVSPAVSSAPAAAPEAVYPAEMPSSMEKLPEGAGISASTGFSKVPVSVGNTFVEDPSSSEAPAAQPAPDPVPEEVRAIWISYLDFYTIARNKSEAEFTANIAEVFQKSRDFGLNTVFVQVRPFGDAMYESQIFPWSNVLTGTEGVDPGYDPLAIMVQEAKKQGLRIEAWVNPYRIKYAGSNWEMSSDNPAVSYINSGSGAVIEYAGGISYNPASKTAQQLIIDGVVEIVENYDVDGIHFDDYFYPTTDTAFDKAYYNAYLNAGGTLSLSDWRRENVNALVRGVYAAVKQANPNVLFGISPQARVDVNYNTQYADVQKWLSEPGYVDYICPQIYFGFENQAAPFSGTLAEWNRMAEGSGAALYVGLAAYKCGTVDNYAGSGKNEWLNSTDMMARMVAESREQSSYGGFVLYRYDSLFRPEAAVSGIIAEERENLKAILD